MCSRVVQDWPDVGTNCRSSVQARHAPGEASEGGYCVPHAEQMNAGMNFLTWSRYVSPRVRVSSLKLADHSRRHHSQCRRKKKYIIGTFDGDLFHFDFACWHQSDHQRCPQLGR